MEEVLLKATRRTVIGKQVKALRRQGILPAVLYGHSIEPTPVVLDFKETSRILGHLASSALINIEMEGERHLALVREKQRNYLTGNIIHIDFQVVSMKEKLRVDVVIELTGLSPAVKNFNGVLVQNLDALEVEALPSDLPERIRVDVSSLENIGDNITVSNLVVPENVEILEDLDTVVVVVTAQAVEEEAEVVEAAGGLEPEVIEKGKKEEEGEEF